MIYIATHKKFNDPKLEKYIPIQVGALGKDTLGYITDDTGENISNKNSSFCELTGLYWIWKNVNDECKGLVHYRRYFGKKMLGNDLKNVYSYDELVKMLDDVDIVLPYVESFKQNAKDELLRECCTEEIFTDLEQIVEERHPEFSLAFHVYFSQNKSVLFNMMFCRREIFDDYCEWLFDILFSLENKVDMSVLNNYQKRLYGFLSERLLNIWIMGKGYKTKNVKVISVEMPILQQLNLERRRITNNIFYKLSCI